MHQSFGLNKPAGLRTPLICHTPKHISLPQYELFNELFIILDGSCAQRTSSINNELPAPLWGAGKALRIIELRFERFGASPSISLSWAQRQMQLTAVIDADAWRQTNHQQMSALTWEEPTFIASVSRIWSVSFFFYLFSNKTWMQIKAIFNTAGGETIRFVPLKVDFTGYEEHGCSNKADSDVVCHLFSISRRWRLAHPALGKLPSSVLVFPADMRLYQNFWHLWFMLYSLWPSNKGRVAHLKSQHRSSSVRSRQPRSFPDMSAAAVNL